MHVVLPSLLLAVVAILHAAQPTMIGIARRGEHASPEPGGMLWNPRGDGARLRIATELLFGD
ncbi:MAG: hypothetical protein WDO56_11965 [Gammaproteobacteria bacterium]